MRRRLVLLLVLVSVPATAAAAPAAPTDGSLAVRAGDGRVDVELVRGAVLGRIANGKIVIVDPRDGDCEALLVWEQGFRADAAEKELRTGELACVFTGRNMRFRLAGSAPNVQLRGENIFLTAVGRGTGLLLGKGGVSDGTYSLNGAPFESLPDERYRVTIGAPLTLTP